ncbi:CLUMA_CG007930, isoform A [Clunio marinus]|uniref:CLUMA_CG007930, isoform A n=1 Tax=Clunio marinus TaxID=568069 RepID=A0A1J1I256_9DIPT|nr:CLUMA_CG007930, isoform A [Clunio marinus]
MTETQKNLKGKVKSVCQEWLVREDNALAYQLQNQEINDHYKGNRYRNQIVRQDFPTALSEQIREKENAERQAMLYHQMVEEQEQADAIVAREYADRLRREAEIERKIQQEKSEMLARKLIQKPNLHVKVKTEEPSLPIPPRTQAKPSTSNKYMSHSPDISPQLHYACLDLMPPDPQRKLVPVSPDRKYTKISLQSHTPEKIEEIPPPPRPAKGAHLRKQPKAPQQQMPSDTIDSIRNYSDVDTALDEALDMELGNLDINNLYKPTQNGAGTTQFNPNIHQRHPHHQFLEDSRNILKQSPEKISTKHGVNKYLHYDDDDEIEEENAVGGVMMTNAPSTSNDPQPSSSSSNYREKIERLQALKVLGLPPEEIREIDKRIEQEKKDEELARMLQDSENKFANQEEIDRKYAMEAQDKELAKMLQEREKAKAKRAKERARQKKEMLRQQHQMENGEYREMFDVEGGDSYSNPVDMLQTDVNRKHQKSPDSGHHQYSHQKQSSYNSQSSGGSYHQHHHSDDSYSNPVDMVPPPLHQRSPPQRPSHLDIRGQLNRPQPPRAHLPDDHQNVAAMIDPTYATPSPPSTLNSTPLTNNSMTPDILEHYDDNSPSTAPYMPIQGTRRTSNSNEKKKKQKERCNQQ